MFSGDLRAELGVDVVEFALTVGEVEDICFSLSFLGHVKTLDVGGNRIWRLKACFAVRLSYVYMPSKVRRMRVVQHCKQWSPGLGGAEIRRGDL